MSSQSLPPTMRAIYYQKYGGLDVLQYSDQFTPVPSFESSKKSSKELERSVLVKIVYSSINPFDYKIRSGFFQNILLGKPSFPLIPSSDMSGIVVQTGSSASRFKVGDEVFGINGEGGCLAEYNIFHEESIALKPKELSHAEASTIPMVGLTAHQSLVNIGKVKKGSRVLILGASGNVGSYCVQYARNVLEAEVYAGCTTDVGMEIVKDLKPLSTFSIYGDAKVEDKNEIKEGETVKDFEYNTPDVDVIIDLIGDKDLKKRAWKFLRSRQSKYIQVGLANEPISLLKMISIGTYNSWRRVISTLGLGPEYVFFTINTKNQSDTLEQLAEYHTTGKIQTRIAEAFNEMSLESIKSAFSMAESRNSRGKILMQVCKLLPQYDRSVDFINRSKLPAHYRFAPIKTL